MEFPMPDAEMLCGYFSLSGFLKSSGFLVSGTKSNPYATCPTNFKHAEFA
jgi:hypothetical protein